MAFTESGGDASIDDQPDSLRSSCLKYLLQVQSNARGSPRLEAVWKGVPRDFQPQQATRGSSRGQWEGENSTHVLYADDRLP